MHMLHVCTILQRSISVQQIKVCFLVDCTFYGTMDYQYQRQYSDLESTFVRKLPKMHSCISHLYVTQTSTNPQRHEQPSLTSLSKNTINV